MRRLALFLTLLCGVTIAASAHVGDHPSVHDTVAGIIERLRTSLGAEELIAMTHEEVAQHLTEEEKHILGTQHLVFRSSEAVTLYVMTDARQPEGDPFWLEDRGFEKTDGQVKSRRTFNVWKKNFDPGEIGLGVNSLSGDGDHYFVAMQPLMEGAEIELSEIYPGRHTVGTMEKDALIYSDNDYYILELPDELDGGVLLRGYGDADDDAQLTEIFRVTQYPATDEPDHVVLTWSEDPKTTQTVQWRTSANVGSGAVAYIKKADRKTVNPSEPVVAQADTMTLETPNIVNDPVVNRHTAVLRDLEPDTTYLYAVGDGSEAGWSEYFEFTTAPDGIEPFSFVYMGDAQNGLERWGTLVHNAYNARKDAKFFVMAGDLVNRGSERDDWDMFFEKAQGVYDRRQLIPVPGNHEYHGPGPELYLKQFTLPENGPDTIDKEKAYTIRYSNALFVMLDSNVPAETQTPWLEEQLKNSDATWKFVVYHHPAYASAPNRDNEAIRTQWGALFDKYHVDIALQGHDHAYLRTFPMKGGEKADSPADGTIYIVSVSGTKYYDQEPNDYIEVGMTNISLYQTLDIQIMGDRLVYRAYDIDGNLKDRFIIEK